MAVSGAVRRMWRAATAPFMLGMAKSMTTTLRPEFGGQLHRLVAVFGFADHRDHRVVFQHAAEAAAHQAVIVHQQHGNARFSHGSPAQWRAP